MRRREFIGLLGGSAVAWPVVIRSAKAQSLSAPRKIGYLHPASIERTFIITVLWPRWRELGYIEGETVLLRSAEGDISRLPSLAAELIGLGVDVMVVVGSSAVRAALAATSVTPVVAELAASLRPDRRKSWGMADREQEITFADVRDMGVRGLLIYCSDYKCSQPSGIVDDSIETALQRFRGRMTDGRSTHSDFTAVQRLREDLSNAVQSAQRSGFGNRARLLRGLLREVDQAMENAIEGCLAANRNFAKAAPNIEAIDQGLPAARRGRTEDTIPAFDALTPQAQQTLRACYVDPLIEAAQGGADVRPDSNRQRTTVSILPMSAVGDSRYWAALPKRRLMFHPLLCCGVPRCLSVTVA